MRRSPSLAVTALATITALATGAAPAAAAPAPTATSSPTLAVGSAPTPPATPAAPAASGAATTPTLLEPTAQVTSSDAAESGPAVAGHRSSGQLWRPGRYEVSSLGTPLTDVLVLGGTPAPAPDGRDALWVSTGGKPSHLHAVDPTTGATLFSQALSHGGSEDAGYAEGGYGVTATPNGDVYVGTYYDGHLYRRKAGATSAIEDLGQALPDNTYVYRLVAAEGKIFGGTNPGGRLFSYDPATSSFRDYGQVIPGQIYARSVAAAPGTVYVGTYDCHIVAVDPTSGAKNELPQPTPNCGHIQDMNVIGDRLYARAGNSIIDATQWVWDIPTKRWVGSIPHVAGLDLSQPGPDGKVYFMSTDGAVGTLCRFDPVTLAVERLAPQVAGRVTNNRGVGWMELRDPAWPGKTLVQMLWRGALLLYNPATGRSTTVQSTIQGEPIAISALATGEKNVYVGGLLNGGLGIVDPATGEKTFNRFAQIESIHADGDKVYLGSYPDARAFVYDRTTPWSNAAYSPGPVGAPPNPALLFDGKATDQNRMPAVADLGASMVFGTQPGTSLTGAVVVVDKATRATRSFVGPIADQSNVALAPGRGLAPRGWVFGGTSIRAAYAQPKPTTTTATLFALDSRTGRKIWSVTPKQGQPALRGVQVDLLGQVWALSGGTLTAHLPWTGQRYRTLTLDAADGGVGELAFDARRNVLWALVGGRKLYRVDPILGRASLVADRPMAHIAAHPNGDVYAGADAELLRIHPA